MIVIKMIKIWLDNALCVILLYLVGQKDRQCQVHGTSPVGLFYSRGSSCVFPDIWLDMVNSYVTHKVLTPVHKFTNLVTVRETLHAVLTAVC